MLPVAPCSVERMNEALLEGTDYVDCGFYGPFEEGPRGSDCIREQLAAGLADEPGVSALECDRPEFSEEEDAILCAGVVGGPQSLCEPGDTEATLPEDWVR